MFNTEVTQHYSPGEWFTRRMDYEFPPSLVTRPAFKQMLDEAVNEAFEDVSMRPDEIADQLYAELLELELDEEDETPITGSVNIMKRRPLVTRPMKYVLLWIAMIIVIIPFAIHEAPWLLVVFAGLTAWMRHKLLTLPRQWWAVK